VPQLDALFGVDRRKLEFFKELMEGAGTQESLLRSKILSITVVSKFTQYRKNVFRA